MVAQDQDFVRPPDQYEPRSFEFGFDATGVLPGLKPANLFRASTVTTSYLDQQELIAAAKEELKKAQLPGGRMPDQDKLELADQVVDTVAGDGEDGSGASFPQKLGQLLRDANALPPEVTIEYRDLRVEADALVGAAGLPSLGNTIKSVLKRAMCQGGLKTQNFEILRGVTGVLRPGTATLLLGPPGSGKTVMLQALSRRLRHSGSTRISGSLLYNGVPGSEFVVQRSVAYVDQLDYHIPTLTVKETCQFSFDCQMSTARAAVTMAEMGKVAAKLEQEAAVLDLEKQITRDEHDMEAGQAKAGAPALQSTQQAPGAGVLDAQFVSMMRELVKQRAQPFVILKLLGLSDVADTVVGDAMLRGISGGQRKRVTTAEILCGPQSVLLMDEISTGLDSATTYSVVQTFVQVAHAVRKTFVISLLQPAPEVVRLFDDIILLTDGRVIFHGPVPDILPFFAGQLDLVCPVRKDMGSFLQEVTTPVGQYAYATAALLARKGLNEADRDPVKLITAPPRDLLTSVEDIEATFWKDTKFGQGIMDTLEHHPFNPDQSPPGALLKDQYANGWLKLTRLVLRRQLTLNKRDRAFYVARALQTLILGLIVASLFATISPTPEQGRQVMALASLSCQSMAMMSSPQIGLVFANKRVFYKQRDNRFFPPASYVFSYLLTQLPQSTLETILYSVVVYWIAGLTATAGAFFSFLIVLWSISNCMAGFYRMLGYAVPSMVVANATGALMLLFLMLTNGFSIVKGSIPDYLVWIYWINPLAWAVHGVVANELGQARWGIPLPGTPSISVGQAAAQSFDFSLGSKWVWGSVAVSWGSLLLYSLAGVVALWVTQPPQPRPTVAEDEQKEEVKRGLLTQLQCRANKGAQQVARSLSMGLGLKAAAEKEVKPATDDCPKPEGEGMGMAGGVAGAAPVRASGIAMMRQKTVVPFQPITLVCRNIRYYVPDPSKGTAPGVVHGGGDREIQGKLELLKGIDFYAEPGSLTALMGGSGAGKTTLLDVTLGRKTVGLIRGDILVNGHPKEQATWSRVCGYVEQSDIHSAGTTVREALMFSARLRLVESIPLEQVTAVVEDTLDIVDLTTLQHNIVGAPGGEGLSVEQRKRLSIAVELVANPSVVFMDEPTSGLDARAAAIVMRAVKNVSLSKRTVMVTIHQPSMEIFEAFDTLVLLQRGGKLTYFGPLGTESSALIAYLEGQPGVEPIQPGYNPATWMLEVTGGSMSTMFKSAGHDFPALYAASKLRQQNEARMDELVEEGTKNSKPLSLASKYATSFSTQRTWLTRKFFKLYWRNPNYNFVRFFMTICIALVLGLVYMGQGKLDADSGSAEVANVQNIMGLIFTLTIFLGMFNCMTVQPVMGAEREVFYRERSSSYYSPGPYAAASGLVEVPYLMVQSFLMVVITYWMVGFEAVAWKFFYFLLLYFLSLTLFTFFGQFMVFVTPSILLAQLLAAFLNQIWSIFAGFMVPYPVMPVGWKWMNRISPTTWMLYGLCGSQLGDRDIPMQGFNGQTTTVSEFLEQTFGYKFSMIWWCCLIVFAYCFFFRGVSTIMLTYVNFQRR